MGQFYYVIKDEIGIHARPAGELAKIAQAASGKIILTKGDKSTEMTKLLAMLSLGVKQGDEVRVQAEDDAALAQIRSYFENNL